ncbi:hypothetical protein CAPN002_19500 [Capnocytophaga stomatis]|uniref:hypothetical protein n=1 Tax=Capnocytophaga stomatis TaxID=1848904 RepID=UPI00194ED3D1|nr:hypothetical protein [Capnocytophaga stomatis]GIJ94732.1 hypothetical protein CAPN002_19500 [Capnocytophaga stomatis]
MFRLKKHYFDGIDAQGNAIILYYAELKLFGIKIPYTSYISSIEGIIKEKSILQKAKINEKCTSFENKKINVSGSWQTLESSISEILLSKNNKKLLWNCIIPKARFLLNFGDKKLTGFGYCEVLEMNFVPWKLPISVLKWGRFLSENHCIVWIEWQGESPLQKVFWNGKLIEKAIISDAEIYFPKTNAKLKFENPIIIKNETLSNIANKYFFLKPFFNKKFLQSRETKYKSPASLIFNNQFEKGFSLYETVLWKK